MPCSTARVARTAPATTTRLAARPVEPAHRETGQASLVLAGATDQELSVLRPIMSRPSMPEGDMTGRVRCRSVSIQVRSASR